MSRVILKGYIVVPDSERAVIEQALAGHIELTRNEPGCLLFEVVQDTADKNRFNVYEEFIDRAAFDAHQNRAKRSNWGKITTNVERHYTIVEQD